MHNRIGFNSLGLKASHRDALLRNMVTSLFRYEKIETTKAKGKEVQRVAEKLITRAKIDSVHNRRIIARKISDKAVLAKLFLDIAPRYSERSGGYSSLLKLGFRKDDSAELVVLRLVDDSLAPEGKKS